MPARFSPEGEERVLYRAREGDFLAEASLFGTYYHCDAICTRSGRCVQLPAAALRWHAVAAPIHMSAVHFGAAIESLQSAFVQDTAKSVNKSILEDAQWEELSKKLDECITTLGAPLDKKAILSNKVRLLNNAPQSIIMNRFLEALGIQIGAAEKSAWQNRNKAAHGKSVNQDNAVQVIRETKALRILMNRILLAIGHGSDFYYDYYTLGRPTSPLGEPIPDDNKK